MGDETKRERAKCSQIKEKNNFRLGSFQLVVRSGHFSWVPNSHFSVLKIFTLMRHGGLLADMEIGLQLI